MLRLEREKKRSILLTVRTRKHWLSRELLIALSIASTIHLLPLALFQIDKTDIEYDWVSAPIQLETEEQSLMQQELEAYAYLPAKLRLICPPVALSNPQPMSLSAFSTIANLPDLSFPTSATRCFETIEEDWDYLWMPKSKKPDSPIEISFSGELADLTVHSSIQPKVYPQIPTDTVIHYFVKVEGKTGKIFWLDRKGSGINEPLETVAKEILKNIAFDTSKERFIYTGEIALHFAKM